MNMRIFRADWNGSQWFRQATDKKYNSRFKLPNSRLHFHGLSLSPQIVIATQQSVHPGPVSQLPEMDLC